MRKNILLLAGILFTGYLSAQNVHYTVLQDDPEIRSKFNLNLDLFQMDFSTSILDASSFNVGLWGHYEITDNRLQAEWLVRKSWFVLGRLGNNKLSGNFEINAGVNFFLSSATRQKNNIKIVLKTEYKGTYYNFSKGAYYSIEEVTFIQVPGKVHKNKGVRGGVYSKTNPYIIDYEKVYPGGLGNDFEGKMNAAGIYLGGIINRTLNIFIKTDEYGVQYNSISDNFYADILVLPVVSFSPLTPNANAGINEESVLKTKLGSPLGFRIGWKRYQVAPKKLTGKKFGMSGSFEAGIKPYLGLFFNGGISITLVK